MYEVSVKVSTEFDFSESVDLANQERAKEGLEPMTPCEIEDYVREDVLDLVAKGELKPRVDVTVRDNRTEGILKIRALMLKHDLAVVTKHNAIVSADLISDPIIWVQDDIHAGNCPDDVPISEVRERFLSDRSYKTLTDRSIELGNEVLSDIISSIAYDIRKDENEESDK